jgi:hypothetical protein
MNDELLLAMLFFGFRLLVASLVIVADKLVFPSPNAGADPIESVCFALPVTEVPVPSLLPGGASADALPSFGYSFMLGCNPFDLLLALVSTL